MGRKPKILTEEEKALAKELAKQKRKEYLKRYIETHPEYREKRNAYQRQRYKDIWSKDPEFMEKNRQRSRDLMEKDPDAFREYHRNYQKIYYARKKERMKNASAKAQEN